MKGFYQFFEWYSEQPTNGIMASFNGEYDYVEETQWEGIYHECFPQEWAVNHEPDTGPEACGNCAYYGCVGDVFVGYCANCAIHVYKGSRGRGFYGDGKEFDIEGSGRSSLDYPSAFDTYLECIVFPDVEKNVVSDDEDDDMPDLIPIVSDDEEDDYTDMPPLVPI